MGTYTGNQLIAAINDGSILESGVGSSLKITSCKDQQLVAIIDYLVQHDLASNLRELDLSLNRLTSLPESIGNLNNLTWLNLSFNKLTSLPASFGNLNNLTWLNLGFNKLTSLPSLHNLAVLELYDNPLETLPIVALTWQNKVLDRDILFTKLQKKLQLEVKQFSDIMAGLVATYLDLANKLGHYNKNLCDTFYKIFLSEGNDNPMVSHIMRYALQDADRANEPQLTADKNGFWPFFVEKRDLQFKVQEKQTNKKEPEASETRDKQLTTTSSIMKCSFTHNDIAKTAFLALLAVVFNQLFYNQTTAGHFAENMSEPDGMMYTY